jgi:hypothetical protein
MRKTTQSTGVSMFYIIVITLAEIWSMWHVHFQEHMEKYTFDTKAAFDKYVRLPFQKIVHMIVTHIVNLSYDKFILHFLWPAP